MVLYAIARDFSSVYTRLFTLGTTLIRLDMDLITDYDAAKTGAKDILLNEGYEQSLFKDLMKMKGSINGNTPTIWPIYAEGLSNVKFKVEIGTISNNAKAEGDDNPTFTMYFKQSCVTPRMRLGVMWTVDKESHWTRKLARAAISSVLFDENTSKDDFVEYAEYVDA
ncbi:hypothetical protein BKA67DRAFT_664620 [Truncatella angustata]|uniref:Uncharacterized protein n=1 Tax=Truncatella angustata TaxID=152316 RepID=A0A9P8RLK5_9PEZI|nr:uncharacterized protein BKA67DRAFT_664620 [Truncatella angustata]KAH6645555.1 hypothetical protein BKA67DRAFT_664620 [Truncatella angustata]